MSIIIAALVVLVSGPFVYANDEMSLVLTDAQIATIRLSCRSTQATLTRIHTNDALNRVHLGREYETLSTKFMAPMNSRVALAKLDGVALTKTTVEFNAKLDEFRSLYQKYEQSLLNAMQIKCADQPVSFYDALVLARDHRADVRKVVVELSDLVTQYSNQVSALRENALSLASKEQGAS